MKKALFLLCLLICIMLVSGCTAGDGGNETAELSDTTAETEAIPDDEAQAADAVTVISNDGGFGIKTEYLTSGGENSGCRDFEFDSRYTLYITYSSFTDNESQTWDFRDITLHVFDKKEGKFLPESFALEDSDYYMSWDISYKNGGCIICTWELNQETQLPIVHSAYEVKCDDGIFSVSPVEEELYPIYREHFTSPDGKSEVYSTLDDGVGHGRLMLLEGGKEPLTVKENVMLEDSKKYTINDVRGYAPAGFIDNTHFVYSIYGWEWTVGYGIYDIQSGKSETFENGKNVIGVDASSGLIYTSYFDHGDYSTEYYKTSMAGDEKLILRAENGDGIEMRYTSGYLIKISADGNDPEMSRVAVLDADADNATAELSMKSSLLYSDESIRLLFCDKTITAVVPVRLFW